MFSSLYYGITWLENRFNTDQRQIIPHHDTLGLEHTADRHGDDIGHGSGWIPTIRRMKW